MAPFQGVVAAADGAQAGMAAALMVRSFMEAGIRPVFAIDAHPGANLAESLGVEAGATVSDVMEQVLEVEEKAKELLLEQRVQQECVAEGKGFDLLTMGRPGGVDAHCYLNSVSCESLENLKKNYAAIVTACEMELQHICRHNRRDIDCLVVLGEPVGPGLEDAAWTLGRAEDAGVTVRRRLLVWSGDSGKGVPSTLREVAQFYDVNEIIILPLDEMLRTSPGESRILDSPLPASCKTALSQFIAR